MNINPLSSHAQAQAVQDPALSSATRRATPASSAPLPASTPATAVERVASPNTHAQNAKLDTAVAALNDFLKPSASSLQFSVDEDSGRTVVKVVDTDTNELVRQYPSKEALAISKELGKLQGLLLRDKA